MKLHLGDQQRLRRERDLSEGPSDRWWFALALANAIGDAVLMCAGVLVIATIGFALLHAFSPGLGLIAAGALAIVLLVALVPFAHLLLRDLAHARRGILRIDYVAQNFIVVLSTLLGLWLITDLLLSAL